MSGIVARKIPRKIPVPHTDVFGPFRRSSTDGIRFPLARWRQRDVANPPAARIKRKLRQSRIRQRSHRSAVPHPVRTGGRSKPPGRAVVRSVGRFNTPFTLGKNVTKRMIDSVLDKHFAKSAFNKDLRHFLFHGSNPVRYKKRMSI